MEILLRATQTQTHVLHCHFHALLHVWSSENSLKHPLHLHVVLLTPFCCCLVTRLYLTLLPILLGSSVRGISQARILEWVAMPSSRGSSRDWPCVSYVSCIGRWVLYQWATRGASHPTWDSTFCAGRCYLSHMDALLILPVCWHLDQATFLGGTLPLFEWVPNLMMGHLLQLCQRGCLFSPLFGLWYLNLSATHILHWYSYTISYSYTTSYSHIILASLSLSSPTYGSDTLYLATAISPHPNFSLMPIWLGPNTSFLDWIV